MDGSQSQVHIAGNRHRRAGDPGERLHQGILSSAGNQENERGFAYTSQPEAGSFCGFIKVQDGKYHGMLPEIAGGAVCAVQVCQELLAVLLPQIADFLLCVLCIAA